MVAAPTLPAAATAGFTGEAAPAGVPVVFKYIASAESAVAVKFKFKSPEISVATAVVKGYPEAFNAAAAFTAVPAAAPPAVNGLVALVKAT